MPNVFYAYVRYHGNKCGDIEDMYTITNRLQCEAAAQVLGLDTMVAVERQDAGRPHGCIYSGSDKLLVWYSPINAQHDSAPCGSIEIGSDYNKFDCLCYTQSTDYA